MAKPPTKLAAVTAEVTQGIKVLGKASDDLSRRSRAAINGVFGGSLCATAAYIASINVPSLDATVFFALATITGLAGGVAFTRGFLRSGTSSQASESALETNNAVFVELLERSQHPALSAAQRKLLQDQAMSVSVALAQSIISSQLPATPISHDLISEPKS